MIEESVKMIHFNEDHPKFSNIYITNLTDKYAIVFDGKKFAVKNKTNVLTGIIQDHMSSLIGYKSKYNKNNPNTKIKTKLVNAFEKLQRDICNTDKKYYDEETNTMYKNYQDYKIDLLKIFIYNCSDKNKLEEIKKLEYLFEAELSEFDSDDDGDNKLDKEIIV